MKILFYQILLNVNNFRRELKALQGMDCANASILNKARVQL